MIVREQRAALAVTRGQSEQIREQRLDELARTLVADDRTRRGIQSRPQLAKEVFPGAFVAGAARAGETEVRDVQGDDERFDGGSVGRLASKTVFDARGDDGREGLARDAPPARATLVVEPRE